MENSNGHKTSCIRTLAGALTKLKERGLMGENKTEITIYRPMTPYMLLLSYHHKQKSNYLIQDRPIVIVLKQVQNN